MRTFLWIFGVALWMAFAPAAGRVTSADFDIAKVGAGGVRGAGRIFSTWTQPPASGDAPPPRSDGGRGVRRVSGAAGRQGPRRWLLNPVAFDVSQYPLDKFLLEFAAAQGVAGSVSAPVAGAITGKFYFDDPGELLDALCEVRHINWYFDGGTVLFFSNSEMTSRLFQLDGRNEATLRQTLIELGFFDPRFGWRVADSNRLLMVQGPAAYLDKVSDVLKRQQPEPEPEPYVEPAPEVTVIAPEPEKPAEKPPEKELGVFRLNHAWAAERSIIVGDADTVVPGVADILRQMLGEAAAAPATVRSQGPTPPGSPRLRRGTGVIGREREQQSQPAQPPETASAVPFIQADTRLNAVLIWDYPENLVRYRAIIERLDLPLALVEIRAAILDVRTNRTRDLGISWEFKGDGKNWDSNVGSNVGSGADRNDYKSISGNGLQYSTIYTRGLDQFMMRASALEKDGNANILSRPSVLTQDNIMASIEHTETFYVSLVGEREVDLADITTGLTLRVTPHVIKDGEGGIQLAVYIVNGSDTYNDQSSADNLPRVQQSTISTQAVVHEGEALIIGGYYTEERSVSESGIPFLKNIPGIGNIFRSRGRTNEKYERLFVLSPRIVIPGESPMVDGTESQRAMTFSPGETLMNKPAQGDPVPTKKKRGSRQPPSLKNQRLLD